MLLTISERLISNLHSLVIGYVPRNITIPVRFVLQNYVRDPKEKEE